MYREVMMRRYGYIQVKHRLPRDLVNLNLCQRTRTSKTLPLNALTPKTVRRISEPVIQSTWLTLNRRCGDLTDKTFPFPFRLRMLAFPAEIIPSMATKRPIVPAMMTTEGSYVALNLGPARSIAALRV
jgi:hypothetical protein